MPQKKLPAAEVDHPDTQYTTHDVAAMLQCDPSTVSKWTEQGKLLAFKTPGGHRRIRQVDLLAFLEEFRMPVPPQLGGDGSLPAPVKKTAGRR